MSILSNFGVFPASPVISAARPLGCCCSISTNMKFENYRYGRKKGVERQAREGASCISVEGKSALADVASADGVWRVAVDESTLCALDAVQPLPPGECLDALPEVVARALP